MNQTYKVLKSVIDYGGTIEKFSSNSVKIAGAYYIRNQFEFRVDVKEDSNGI